MIDKRLLKKRFSRGAATYDQYARVQKKTAQRLLQTAEVTPDIRTVLEVGCGTGRLTQRLLRSFPEASITAMDLAPGMIDVAKKRLSSDRVHLICGDIEETDLSGSYDLIVSNAVFQWLNDVEQTIGRLYQALSSKGVLAFSTFGHDTFWELHAAYAHAAKAYPYRVDGAPGPIFYALQTLKECCHRATDDSALIATHEEKEEEYYPDVRSFFVSLRKIGANNSNAGRSVQNPGFFKEMMRTYEREFRCGSNITATYHCLYFNVIKNGVPSCTFGRRPLK